MVAQMDETTGGPMSEERVAELLALLDSQAELVGAIAHEIKGQLNSVRGGVYLLQSGLKRDDSGRIDSGLSMLERNADRIERTVADVLYYVKDRAVNPTAIDLEAVLEHVKKLCSGRAQELGVRLRAKTRGGSLRTDELALRALLANLLEFALRGCHGAKLKPSPSVKLTASDEGGYARFVMVGDGLELSDDARERALKPYYRPDGPDRSLLELFITRKLVLRQGGSFEVAPPGRPGVTEIILELPAAPAEEELA